MKKEENKLSDLSVGEACVVSDLFATGFLRQRLFDLGICRSAHIECIGRSPFGDPTLFLIRGKMIAIRENEARLIAIIRENN